MVIALKNGMRPQIYYILLIFMGLLLIQVSNAAPIPYAWRQEDKKHGYTDQVDPEKEDPGIPLVFIENPEDDLRTLREKIFDPTLTKEFSVRYRDKFGQTEAETFYTRSNVLEYFVIQGREYSQEQYFQEQKNFSTYMVRRTAEYHFDKNAKNHPVAARVSEVKERVKNVNFSISKNIKFKANYSISSNDLRLDVNNPVCKAGALLQMKPDQLYPGPVQTTRYNLGKGIGTKHYLDTYYTSETGVFQVVATRTLSPVMSVSLNFYPNYLRYEKGVGLREQITLAGYSWSF